MLFNENCYLHDYKERKGSHPQTLWMSSPGFWEKSGLKWTWMWPYGSRGHTLRGDPCARQNGGLQSEAIRGQETSERPQENSNYLCFDGWPDQCLLTAESDRLLLFTCPIYNSLTDRLRLSAQYPTVPPHPPTSVCLLILIICSRSRTSLLLDIPVSEWRVVSRNPTTLSDWFGHRYDIDDVGSAVVMSTISKKNPKMFGAKFKYADNSLKFYTKHIFSHKANSNCDVKFGTNGGLCFKR